MNIPKTKMPRVVIVGGGFAGISIAKKLKGLPIQLVMFDRHNYHTFQPLLYQVSTSGLEADSIAYPLRKIMKKHKNFHFRMAEVKNINPTTQVIDTNIGSLEYDYLVIATGTKTNYFGNKQIEYNALPMKTVPQALDIRSFMLQNFEKASVTENDEERQAYMTFVVVGGGPTGVELAGALAELKRKVFPKDYPDIDLSKMEIHLLEGAPRLLPPMSETASKKAEKFLRELGVTIHLKTLVTQYDGTNVETKEGVILKASTFIWSAGVTGNPVLGVNENAIHDKVKRYIVNEYNQVDGYNNIFAIGDIALMMSDEYPKGHPQLAQPAIQQGELLAKNLMNLINNKPMKPFKYIDKGSMATIGRNKAVADIKKLHFGGFFAWFIWMFVHLFSLVGFRNRVITFFNWMYNYINYDKAARSIFRYYKRENKSEVVVKKEEEVTA
ncbi:NAD(P)/FAD-dependent oxidoreductase [Neptunitalea lumnitzerae]|uniref:NADH:ubiquinone reductase (non-electrogenic) n=1 Tax=Neptunitalea lumnitzerae TaxID=2965509 RepID=A0ABQ5MME3_9FLAO|nr:NAD(P)/FAD-dependent oxidoreductase [Neptunitalea sp. Y10]GLB50255.1 NADH dehydrogenase [Neptunitalea sp. Y10]